MYILISFYLLLKKVISLHFLIQDFSIFTKFFLFFVFYLIIKLLNYNVFMIRSQKP